MADESAKENHLYFLTERKPSLKPLTPVGRTALALDSAAGFHHIHHTLARHTLQIFGKSM